MITLERPAYYDSKRYNEYCGLSTDDKATISAYNGDEFYEINTGKYYKYNQVSNEWVEQPTSGGGGGGSVPKPLTYDYMPEGYPSKSVGTVTLMEEQEVTFTNSGGIYQATAPVKIDISDGQTYTIVWDGAEYSCVGHVAKGVAYIGNPSALGAESTSEPFLYANANSQSLWVSYDTSASHTIKVTTIGTVYQTIDVNMLPKAGEGYGVVKKDEIVTAYVFPNDLAPQAEMNKAVDDFMAGKAKITWRGDNIIFARRISDTEIIIRTSKDPVNSYRYTVDKMKHTYNKGRAQALEQSEIMVQKIYIKTEDGLEYVGPIMGASNTNEASDEYIKYGSTRIYQDGIAIKSSDSTKMFKITVNDSGTISATEVT